MNYGLQHRYHARSLGTSVINIPGYGKLYPIDPTPKPVTPKPATPIVSADAAPAICLDETENSVSCFDPNCKYGDCGAPAGVQQITVGALCLDQTQNQIDCTSPNCTYGDCVSGSWWSKSSIITGVPDVAIYVVLAALLFGGGIGVGRR